MATKTYENIADRLLMKTGLDQPTPGSVAFSKIGEVFEKGLTPLSQQYQKQAQIDRKEFGMSPGKAEIMKMYGGTAATLATQWEDANNLLVNFKPSDKNVLGIANTEMEMARLKTMIKEYKKGNRRTIPFNAMTKILDHVGDIANKRLRFFEEESFKIKGTAGHSAMKGKQKKLEEFLGQIEEFKTKMSTNISDIKQRATDGHDPKVPQKTEKIETTPSSVPAQLEKKITDLKTKIYQEANKNAEAMIEINIQNNIKRDPEYYGQSSVENALDFIRDKIRLKGKGKRIETANENLNKMMEKEVAKKQEYIDDYVSRIKRENRTVSVGDASAYIDDGKGKAKLGTIFYKAKKIDRYKEELPEFEATKKVITEETDVSEFDPKDVEAKFADIERLYNENKAILKELEAEAPADKNKLRINKRAIEEKIRQTIPGYSEMFSVVNAKKTGAGTDDGDDPALTRLKYTQFHSQADNLKEKDWAKDMISSFKEGGSTFVSQFASMLHDVGNSVNKKGIDRGVGSAIENAGRAAAQWATGKDANVKVMNSIMVNTQKIFDTASSAVKNYKSDDSSKSRVAKYTAIKSLYELGIYVQNNAYQKEYGNALANHVLNQDKRQTIRNTQYFSGGAVDSAAIYGDFQRMGETLAKNQADVKLPSGRIFIKDGENIIDIADGLISNSTAGESLKKVYNTLASKLDNTAYLGGNKLLDTNFDLKSDEAIQLDRSDIIAGFSAGGKFMKDAPITTEQYNSPEYAPWLNLYEAVMGNKFPDPKK